MKQIFTLFIVALFGMAHGQTTATFEDISFPADSFLNGSDLNGGFQSGNVFLPNDYNPNFNSFNGWAISNKTDTVTPGFTNQFSAFTGEGFDGSSNYAVAFAFNPVIMRLTGDAVGQPVQGMYITNNTYAYLSMRDGASPPGKAFGGVTGDDPDFLSVSIKAYLGGQLSSDSVEFFLADYRFSDNSQDYIIKDWTFVDLSSLGNVDSLQFTMFSSDTGSFGINTPTYICVDNVQTAGTSTSIGADLSSSFSLYPNPATTAIRFSGLDHSFGVEIYDANGRLMLEENQMKVGQELNIGSLPSGTYFALLRSRNKVESKVFIKQ